MCDAYSVSSFVLLLYRYVQVANYVPSSSRQNFNVPRHSQGKTVRERRASSWRGKGWGWMAAVIRLRKPCEAKQTVSLPRLSFATSSQARLTDLPSSNCSQVVDPFGFESTAPAAWTSPFVFHYGSNQMSGWPFARSGTLVWPGIQFPPGIGDLSLPLLPYSFTCSRLDFQVSPAPYLFLPLTDTLYVAGTPTIYRAFLLWALCFAWLLECPLSPGPFPSRIFPSSYGLG